MEGKGLCQYGQQPVLYEGVVEDLILHGLRNTWSPSEKCFGHRGEQAHSLVFHLWSITIDKLPSDSAIYGTTLVELFHSARTSNPHRTATVTARARTSRALLTMPALYGCKCYRSSETIQTADRRHRRTGYTSWCRRQVEDEPVVE